MIGYRLPHKIISYIRKKTCYKFKQNNRKTNKKIVVNINKRIQTPHNERGWPAKGNLELSAADVTDS
jgi:hypothetical protein